MVSVPSGPPSPLALSRPYPTESSAVMVSPAGQMVSESSFGRCQYACIVFFLLCLEVGGGGEEERK
jgi:hypothetical protein